MNQICPESKCFTPCYHFLEHDETDSCKRKNSESGCPNCISALSYDRRSKLIQIEENESAV